MLAWTGPVIGCSGVAFDTKPNKLCEQYNSEFGSSGCVVRPDGFNQFNYTVTTGKVDIVIVDDNSGSMYTEQVEIADRFPGFLDSISRLDYRLAIITTDVTTNGGGGFLSFPNSEKFLYNTSRSMDARHSDNITQFQNTIKRPETLACDSSGYTNCPSGDERGIYALNQAIERADQRSFFRPGGHLAVVVLSDEDERSNGGQFPGYPMETLDQPVSFAARSKQFLGISKSVSVHSIIIAPGDTQCFNTQNSQPGVKGFYGYNYAALSLPDNNLKSQSNLMDGVIGSICSSNYTAELGNIAAKLNDTVKVIQLPCRPHEDKVDVAFDPVPAQQIYYSIDADNRLNLNPAAPAGTKVSLSYKCKI